MESRGPIDLSWIIAAMIEESPGKVLTVSDEWFMDRKSPFGGKQLKIDWNEGNIYITMEEV